MTHVVLKRFEETAKGTRGALSLDGKFLCHTLEEPWKDNARKVSCIPDGVYKCVTHNGAHFKDVWEVTGVPNRTAILIHAGNTLTDTEGCILVGRGVTHEGISQSRDALNDLRAILPASFTLEVKHA